MSRLALYGDRVPGPELVRLGIATECVADSEVLNRCREIAQRLASFPKGAPEAIVESIRSMRSVGDPEAFFPQRGNSALLTAAQVKG